MQTTSKIDRQKDKGKRMQTFSKTERQTKEKMQTTSKTDRQT